MNHFRYDKDRRTLIPAYPGYYWAKWIKPADGTHEADQVTWPALRWEIVQVNDNNVDDPADDEYLTVSVPGVRETQWRENFAWGQFVAPVAKSGERYSASGAEVEKLRDLVQTLIDNDPSEPIADNGATVLDKWRERARRTIADQRNEAPK